MVVAALALVLATQQVPILSISGNDLWEVCSVNTEQGAACNSYVAGVLDTYSAFETMMSAPDYCVPERATYTQATDVVVEYIRRNPGTRHHPGVVIVLTAVREGFGCNASAFEDEAPFAPPVTLPIQSR